MRRHEVEHVLRAAAAIAGETDFVLLGSQFGGGSGEPGARRFTGASVLPRYRAFISLKSD